MATATVRFATGDCDCSSLIKRILVSCGLMDKSTYMWTGNEVELLENRQFAAVNLWRPQRGDVLWKSGHTEMYLGDGVQGGARIDESGTVHGTRSGDQTGGEVCKSAYDPSSWGWTRCMRYLGSKTVGGIPMGEAMAQLMEHAIEHDASHGYSQPNREGDGGTESVTLTWGGPQGGTSSSPGPTLTVDGWLGAKSVSAWQAALGTVADGVVSGQSQALRSFYPNLLAVEFGAGGSSMVVALQRRLGVAQDGVIGPATVRALQRRLGVTADGVLGTNTAKAVQRSLNEGQW